MLKIERKPSFLSPSSLMMAENMPNTFYLTRLVADSIQREPQGLSAAVGSAFDYYIKMKLIKDKFQHKENLLPEIKDSVETHTTEAFIAGKIAYDAYIKNCLNSHNFTNVELRFNGSFGGVPITGKGDAAVEYAGYDIPFDWKLLGYTSETTTSPLPLYFRLWEGIRPRPAHKNYQDGQSFEDINDKWALQGCVYGWLMDLKPKVGFKEFPFYVDAIIFKNKRIRCIAQYSGWITKSFQERVLIRFQNIWKEINDGSYLKRLVSSKDDNLVWMASTNEVWFKENPMALE